MAEEGDSGIVVSGPQLTIRPPQGHPHYGNDGRSFAFDRCFAPHRAQEELYEEFGREFLDHALEGYNACIFAYGQTGSGKSYTMLGEEPNNPGMIPQICADLFDRLSSLATTTAVTVRLSFLEIYNEQIRDLLGTPGSSSTNLRLRGDEPYVDGLSEFTVRDVGAVLGYLRQGAQQRATASTKMNDQSSRSHAVVTLQIKQQIVDSAGASEEKVSQLRLVDLAGSERATATGATGDRLREGGNINRSLVTLGRVISTLADNPGALAPYRDSVLTRLLQTSLGGNSRTAMIACVSPSPVSYDQTLSTLRYADQAKRITTRARINHDLVSSDAQAKRLAAMQTELNALRQRLSAIPSDSDSDSGQGNSNDFSAKFVTFARFYEEEAAKHQAQRAALEAQKAELEAHNQRMTDYVRELTNRGLSAIDTAGTMGFEEIEHEYASLTADVSKGRTEIAQSLEAWRRIISTA